MKVLYTKKFNKDIDQITNDKKLKKNLLDLITQIKQADALTDVESVRKIQGYDKYYRIRVGDFRLGIKITNDGLEMLRFLHRKNIYNDSRNSVKKTISRSTIQLSILPPKLRIQILTQKSNLNLLIASYYFPRFIIGSNSNN